MFEEEIREFLIESNENLANLDREIVELEQHPDDAELISSVFRTIHTIKGTSGFFGFDLLGAVAHITENILSQVREGQRKLTPELISLILEAVDKIKALLAKIEADGVEGEDDAQELRSRLESAFQAGSAPTLEATTAPPQSSEPVQKPVQESASEIIVPKPVELEDPIAEVAPEQEPGARESSSAKESQSREAHLADSTIRVDVGLLDKLMNLVGELVLARNQLLQDTTNQSATHQTTTLQKTSQRLNLITSELQEGVMKTRMQPIGVVWNKLPRVVRDLASRCGKRVQIEMEGAGTELDKTIIEAVKDPLTHIVRNACDHGIEMPEARMARNKPAEGQLLLRAYHEGGVVNIEISDDGAGIDVEKVKKKAVEKGLIRSEQAVRMSEREARHLIFMPGFSTAAQVTSISGRGVGMDVVKTNIEKIGGSVEVLPRVPCGTTVQIKIPLTLAIIPGLVVSLDAAAGREADEGCAEHRFVVPQANLLELVRLEGKEDLKLIASVHGTPVVHHRGRLLPLVYLNRVLGIPPRSHDAQAGEVVSIVVVQAENRQMGLVVDHIRDTQEIVVKPLGRQLKGLTCYVGATIMGDGLPALILDVAGLARLGGLMGQSRVQEADAGEAEQNEAAGRMQKLLLFRAGRFDRLAVPLSLVARLEEVESERVERASGRAVLHYRGDILPLVSLRSVLDPDREDDSFTASRLQVIVFADGARRIGVVVDHIDDILYEAYTVKRRGSIRGLLGSAVIGGKITDLLDLHALVEASGGNWLERPAGLGRVLLMDPSATAREMLSEYLEFAGYEVLRAAGVSEALPLLEMAPVDMILAATELGVGSRAAELETLRRSAEHPQLPVVGLVDRREQAGAGSGFTFDALMVRADRAALLDGIAGLVRGGQPVLEVAS
ncbi:MAG: chemotaxis protein CheW [Acidobacteriaceae bacterium]